MSKCPSIGEQINKLWHTHLIKYSSAIKKEWTTDTQNLGKHQKYYVEQTKPDIKDDILYIHLCNIQKQAKQIYRDKSEQWLRMRGNDWLENF